MVCTYEYKNTYMVYMVYKYSWYIWYSYIYVMVSRSRHVSSVLRFIIT
jgi:hypothetical protein